MNVKMRIKIGWENAGKTGYRIGPDYQGLDGMWWTPVQWEDEEEPEWYKTKALEWATSTK